jgi:hypothetical protein
MIWRNRSASRSPDGIAFVLSFLNFDELPNEFMIIHISIRYIYSAELVAISCPT